MIVGNLCFLFCSIASLPELEEHGKIFHGSIRLLIETDPILIYFNVFENGRGPGIIVPETGTKGKLFVVIYLGISVLDVKETSLSRQCGTAYPVIFLLSWCKYNGL